MMPWISFGGVLEVELVSAEPEASLASICEAGVEIRSLRNAGELTACFVIHRTDYEVLLKLCRQRGDSLRILRKSGLYYRIKHVKKRRLLLFGIGILLLFNWYLPTRVLFVRIEGNTGIPSNRILWEAEAAGIGFGASRKHVRSEQVKNALLDAIPELQWAGVNTKGCTAVISVRERSTGKAEETDAAVSSIVASRDGYILSALVTQGTGLVQPGQAVKAGQILISGYTDCGISLRAEQAKGEILAQTRRIQTAVTPVFRSRKTGYGNIRRNYSIILGKKRIFFWKGSGIWDACCDRMYEQYTLTLPGGFRLPAALCIDTYQQFHTEEEALGQKAAEECLRVFSRRYIWQQMIAGQILACTESVSRRSDSYCLLGNYTCTEMIGRVKREQIGDTNGKTNRTDCER